MRNKPKRVVRSGEIKPLVSNKLIQDYWREELLLYPYIKEWLQINKAKRMVKRWLNKVQGVQECDANQA